MAEKVIELDYSTYQNLVKIIQNGQENIYFRSGNDMVSIPNKDKRKSNPNNEQNIVQRWMNDIAALTDNAIKNTGDTVALRYLYSIKTYCNAVIVSVTSS